MTTWKERAKAAHDRAKTNGRKANPPPDQYPKSQRGDTSESPPPNGIRPPEPFRPFPLASLPAILREYVRQGALALGCDPAYLALPCLAVAAGLIGYTRVLRLKRTWRVPSVLWTLIVAESGSLKTPAFRLQTDYLFVLQRRLEADYKRELAAYDAALAEWEAARKAAQKGEGDPPGDEPVPPMGRTVFTSDATIEAIAELIGENPRGLLVACDELAAWLGSFSRYKGKAGGTDLPRWLSMHSAGGFAYHRKTGDRRRIVVPNAALSIAGGIQPGILSRTLTDEFMQAGLAGRLFMAMPPRPAKAWSELEIDQETENRYHDLLDSLYALEFDRRECGDVPHVLKLSPDAKAAWVQWYNAWGREQASVEGELAAAFSKLEEAAARFALVHHVVSCLSEGRSDLDPVGVGSIQAGIAIARWFAQETRRVYAALRESDGQRDSRRLVEFIRGRGGKITVRELQRSNGRKYPDAATAEVALDGLAEAGWGRWVEGPRSRTLELRPTPDTSDTSPETEAETLAPLSDSLSDTSRATLVFPGKNGQVSDVSDCRTGLCASPERAEGPPAGVEQKPQVSDKANRALPPKFEGEL